VTVPGVSNMLARYPIALENVTVSDAERSARLSRKSHSGRNRPPIVNSVVSARGINVAFVGYMWQILSNESLRNFVLQRHSVCKTMFIIVVPSTQFSIDTLYVMHFCYVFRSTVAIVRYIQFFIFTL
jgi:hypothetical protein